DKFVLAGACVFSPRTPLVFSNRSSILAQIFAPLNPRCTAAPGCLKAGVPENAKAQYSSQAFRFFQDSSNHPDSEPDRGSKALLRPLPADGQTAQRARRRRAAGGVPVGVPDHRLPQCFPA